MAFVLCVVLLRRREKQRGCFWNCRGKPSRRMASVCTQQYTADEKTAGVFWREEPHPPSWGITWFAFLNSFSLRRSPFPRGEGESPPSADAQKPSILRCQSYSEILYPPRRGIRSFSTPAGSSRLPLWGRGTTTRREYSRPFNCFSLVVVDEVPLHFRVTSRGNGCAMDSVFCLLFQQKRERGEIPTKFSLFVL